MGNAKRIDLIDRSNIQLPFNLVHAIDRVFDTYGDVVAIKPKSLLKFGKNPAVGTSVNQYTVMELAGSEENETYVSSDIIDSLSCTDASFTGDVSIEGHTRSGSDYTFVVQTATANGQNEVSLSTPLARATRIGIVGSTGLSAGNKIYVYDNTSVTLSSGVPNVDSQVHLILSGTDNQSLKASTTISSQDYYFITSWFGSVNKKTAATVDFRLKIRESGGVFRSIVAPITLNTAGKSFFRLPLDPCIIVPKNSDVIMTAVASTTSVEVSGGFNGYLALIQN